ncbi:hypothetical protein JHV666_49660 [Mycobacterium avium subsp. hominissuis]
MEWATAAARAQAASAPDGNRAAAVAHSMRVDDIGCVETVCDTTDIVDPHGVGHGRGPATG